MKTLKKTISLILLFVLLLQLNIQSRVFAANPPMPEPEKLQVKPIYNTLPDIQPAIGYNEFDGSYVDLHWDTLRGPGFPVTGENRLLNFYIQEVTKPYKPSRPLTLKDRGVPGNPNYYRMKKLNSGTIYFVHARAYYSYVEGNNTFTSIESTPSNTVKILTDININAYSHGVNKIKIEWDDVWNAGQRIAYKLYVSENSTFANTPPIYINKDQIGPNGPVTVNQAAGKLEYIHSVRDPGRVYYVKIVPDINEPALKMSTETQTVAASSFILVKTTKMSVTDAGTIWRLDWSPVVTGLNNNDIKIVYQIDKYVNNVPIPMLMETGTNTFISVPPGDENHYYIIRAFVTRNGQPLYPGIKIESDKVLVKDQEVSSYPAAPELVNALYDAYNNPKISYEDIYVNGELVKKGELTPTSATLLWRAPRRANGEVDTSVSYDIWLITDPNTIDTPAASTKIASSVTMTENNQVKDGTRLLGYKYVVPNLTPNSTYYFKIVAKKTFLEYAGDILQNVEYASLPALKVIITPAGGRIEQPLVPGRPPLQVKKNEAGRDMVSQDSMIIQIKNKWYESFNAAANRWEYIDTSNLDAATRSILEKLEAGTLTDAEQLINYRIVEYDPDVKIDVGCIKYVDGMVYEDLASIPANKRIGVSVEANDEEEDASLNIDRKRHNVDIRLQGLDPNTSYIIWVRAARPNANVISEPSDPIVVTTDPIIVEPVEKPIHPVFNYINPADTFVDLGWEINPAYRYYIKYGTTDNINSATGSLTIKPEDLLHVSYYRINGLKQNTLYFFWIQAEAVNGAQSVKSEWSDSYSVKTMQDIPPSTPRGFGVKNAEDSVTKNEITYEWIQQEGMDYILEISGDIDYKDSAEYNIKAGSEFKVEGLRSNYRYYARLYAYDPVKKLRSLPTQSVTVRTKRSNDDYDSDQDIENVISGDYIVKDQVVRNFTWNIKIVGVNADRFIEYIQNDRVVDYRLDLRKPPSRTDKYVILISNKVFSALTKLKENLIILTEHNEFTIRPSMFADIENDVLAKRLGDFNYEIAISYSDTNPGIEVSNMSFKTKIASIAVDAMDGANRIAVKSLNRPLKIAYPYSQSNWYTEGVTSGFTYDSGLSLWKREKTANSYNRDAGKGNVSFDMLLLGPAVVAELGSEFFDDIYGHWAETSINNVFSAYSFSEFSSRRFSPDRIVNVGTAVKTMLDVLQYSYKDDFMTVAAKAGLIEYGDVSGAAVQCTREKAMAMVARVYEIKSGEKAESASSNVALFDDFDKVSPTIISKVKFAAENGIVLGVHNNKLAPKEAITRAELMALLERMLAFIGEID